MTTEKIDLSFHSIGPEGIKALSAPLATNTTVSVMNLTENFCGAPGCQDLAEMLCENCYITELILKGNDIGKKSQEDGGKALAMIIKENSYIKYLDLSDNYRVVLLKFHENGGKSRKWLNMADLTQTPGIASFWPKNDLKSRF